MIPFFKPRISEDVIREVTEALNSGWITTGPKTKQFEKEITAYCGNNTTVCVNSASAGMEMVLRMFGIKEGDEVIVPAYTYCATANVVVHCGAEPVMVDVNPDDFNISVEAIRAAITPKTKAIMPVDLGGLPCDYDAINAMVNEANIKAQFYPGSDNQKKLGRILVLSDSAHSFGASAGNKRAGALTDVSVFSFHAVKNLTTAEGGAVAFNLPDSFDHDEVYKEFCIKILHGQSKDALAKSQLGGWKYDVIEAGHKCNMSDIQAAIGLAQMRVYDEELSKRREIFNKYTEVFSQCDWAQIPLVKEGDKESSYHVYLLRIKEVSEEVRDEIMNEIFSKQITVNVHFQPLPLLSYYKNAGYKIEDYPVAYDNYSREITLPVYYNLSMEDVGLIADVVKECVESKLVING